MKLVDQILKKQINNKITSEKWSDNGEIDGKVSMDYCPECKREVTYTHDIIFSGATYFWGQYSTESDAFTSFSGFSAKSFSGNPIIFAKATCGIEANNSNHNIYYAYSFIDKKTVWKFAEYPFDLIKMKTSAPNNKILKDLELDVFINKAYQSAQENLHLGAMLYSRRVLEGIVDSLKNPNDKDIEEWKTKTLGNKISEIKSQLPDFVRKNISKLSSVLGDALHNHSDEEAATYYGVIIQMIKIIIQKIEEEANSKKLEQKLESELNKL